jgi:hypothetical protein
MHVNATKADYMNEGWKNQPLAGHLKTKDSALPMPTIMIVTVRRAIMYM